MTYWHAFILGLLQGITEFLPVSSSAHLKLAQIYLGLGNSADFLFFDVVCHVGTLFSILYFFRKKLSTLFFKYKTAVFLGTLPLFPLVLFLKPLKNLTQQPEYLPYFFLFTAFLLLVSEKPLLKPKKNNLYKDSLIVGLFQGLAVIPGISRSGSTISAAKMLGWTKEEAFTFSFLLAIPAILGSLTLEGFSLIFHKNGFSNSPYGVVHLLIGLFTSSFFGYFSLHLLHKMLKNSSFRLFALYLVLLSFFLFFK